MTVTFMKTDIEQALPRYLRYAASLRLVDTFWEWYILDASLYDILLDDLPVGNFSVYEEENRLTSFVLDDAYVKDAQSVFTELLEAFSPESAFVATCDELFLSLCMEAQSSVELQAYFFDDTKQATEPPAFPASFVALATDEDIPELIKLDFFHPLYINNPENLIYVMENESGGFMGAGHIQRMKLARQWGAVGMITDEAYRQQGVGRSLILHLKALAQKEGLVPIAGCNVHNTASRKTLESCGFASKTRLLKVCFSDNAQKGGL